MEATARSPDALNILVKQEKIGIAHANAHAGAKDLGSSPLLSSFQKNRPHRLQCDEAAKKENTGYYGQMAWFPQTFSFPLSMC